MAGHIFRINSGRFGLTATDPALSDACSADVSSFSDFSCIASGTLEAASNITQETVPALWCDSPEEQVPQVGATSFTVNITALPDEDLANGLLQFLFAHDTQDVWWFMGLDGVNPPKAWGKATAVAGAFGGDARIVRTVDLSLPVVGKPNLCLGDAASSWDSTMDLTTAVFGQRPAPFATVTELKADPTYGDGSLAYNGGADFATGQFCVTQDGLPCSYATAAWTATVATRSSRSKKATADA